MHATKQSLSLDSRPNREQFHWVLLIFQMMEGLGPKYKYYSNLQESDVQIKLQSVTFLTQSRNCAIKKTSSDAQQNGR